MKKYVYLLLVGLLAFSACSDDDDPVIQLRKLTKVICYQDNATTPLYQVDIRYKEDGSIYDMKSLNEGTMDFLYAGNTITVNGSGKEKTEYTINGNKQLTAKKVYAQNPYATSVMYVSEEFTYGYTSGRLAFYNWLIRKPLEDGNKYEVLESEKYERYEWENGNMIRLMKGTQIMRLEYSDRNCPSNFPFFITNTFAPTGLDVINPLNYLLGYQNVKLPSQAYCYDMSSSGEVSAEYTFTSSIYEESPREIYVTDMEIKEKIHTPGKEGETTYRLHFEYNN
ncbi:DUF5032 domain-containing protein [Parabacteroides sp. OttesenSCG-928-G07]|nr:DUF5032 domain-containing protein [Parabacteroides sp. OttesenSCG-928-G07]